jgi:hypothetical protein
LSAAAHVQRIVPDAILVGGSGAALYAQHRYSADDDHVVIDLKSRFDQVLVDLEAVSGWQTNRLTRPVQILGNLDGIETGIRNQIRVKPLETTTIETPGGRITVPTLEEMLRIKAWLTISRNATRDYIDVAALADRVGTERAHLALLPMDELYPQANKQSPLQQLVRQLSEPKPYDLARDESFAQYRFTDERWANWPHVKTACLDLGASLLYKISLRHPGAGPQLRPPY